MRRLLLLVPIALALVLPAHAAAGGFATVGLSSTPDGLAAGQPWRVDITVLQHGRTPLEGITPRVRIGTGERQRDFVAEPTGKRGVYRAEVVFPSGGRWDYVVLDGFIDAVHTFPAVEIRAADGAAAAGADRGDGGGGIAAGWLWGAGAALVLAAGLLLLDRRRRQPRAATGGAPEPA